MFAYAITGGSNLDLPENGRRDRTAASCHVHDVLQEYDIVLCISTFSATAPLTALAKQYGFRGATLHGINEVILASGLAVDYEEVSRQAEKLRRGMTRADSVEIELRRPGPSPCMLTRSRQAGSAEKPRPLPARAGHRESPGGRNLFRAGERRRRVSDEIRGWDARTDACQ